MEKENLKGFNKEAYCPIIRPQSEQILRQVVKEIKPKKALEIGTFLGYSAAAMLEEEGALVLTTLEKEPQNAQNAAENLKQFGGRAKVICCDAANFLSNCTEKYDLIFLDGPKGQYFKYLPILKNLLSVGGVLVADDTLFHGYVSASGTVKHKHRTIVESLKKFKEDLQNDPCFSCQFYEIEDGVAVCKKLK